MRARCIWVLIAVAAPAAAGTVRHVPPASVTAATELELVAEAPATSPTITLHYRTIGERRFAAAELVRKATDGGGEAQWVAVVPAAAVAAPGLEYYLDADGAPVFASAEAPHTTLVATTAADDRRGRDLARTRGRRSRVHSAFEWVDYGSKDGLKDSYYRVDADFAYRTWAYPLEELRVGYTRLVGETASAMCPDPTKTCTAGYRVAGWFELGLAPIEGVHLDTRANVMATAEGFALGGRAEGRLGMIDASHVAVGVEYMADVGVSGYFRLGWGTVPDVPMAATVEVTDLPASDRPTGVRLYYDIAHDFGAGVRLGARVGYAARTQAVYGVTGGGSLSIDF